MDDRERVAAIREGNPAGLASAYDGYADALYSFCLSMLHDRASAQDAVQDTFVVLAHRVGQLRDPTRLRAWLYAVARTQCLRQLRASRRAMLVEEWDDAVTAESVDFDGDVHSAQLQALVWQAMGGLNPGERAALELSLRHGLEGDDLAAALDVSRGHANKLLERGRTELERSLGALLVARANAGVCIELAGIVAGWDGVMTVLMRKRIARHIDKCRVCGEQKKHRVSAVALLSAVPLLAAPAALRSAVVGKFRLVSDDVALSEPDRETVGSVSRFDIEGFPTERVSRRKVRGALVAAFVVAVVTGVFALRSTGTPHPHTVDAAASGAVTSSAAPPRSRAVPSSRTVAPPRSSHSSVLPRPRTPTSVARPPVGTTSSHVVAPPPPVPQPTAVSTPAPHPSVSHPHPSVSYPQSSASHPTPSPHPPTASSSSKPKPPPPPAVKIAVSPKTYVAATGGSGVLTISVTGGPIDWTATATNGVTFSPASGTVPAGGTGHSKVIVPASKAGAYSTMTVTWATGSTTVTITWS